MMIIRGQVLLVLCSAVFVSALPPQIISVDLEINQVPFEYNAAANWTSISDCPGHTFSCSKQHACCVAPSGEFGCCPYPDGVCCTDGLHCCPADTKCDLEKSTCISHYDELSMFEFEWGTVQTSDLVAAKKESVDDTDCTGPNPCSETTTCCQQTSGDVGCCPYKNGVCCSDGVHCCPKGMKCDMKRLQCAFKNFYDQIHFYPMSEQMIKESIEEEVVILEEVLKDSSTCADPQYTCDKGQTCCKLINGEFGCCPYDGASCCSDGQHCCPHGFKCDGKGGRCIKSKYLNFGNELIQMGASVMIKKEANVEDSSTCDDPAVKCAKGQTCCKLTGGTFGCCPYNNAICCKDGAHCCPSGTRCDVQHGRCTSKQGLAMPFSLQPWLEFFYITEEPKKEKTAPRMQVGGQKKCPNPEDQCLDGQTCCLIADSEYGCCPLKDATCCPDRTHCCPQDTVCDTKANACRPKHKLLNITLAAAAVEIGLVKATFNDCGEGHLDCGTVCCQGGQTCCPTGDSMGCCPLDNAVCCPDKVHCCPGGMVCGDNPNTPDTETCVFASLDKTTTDDPRQRWSSLWPNNLLV